MIASVQVAEDELKYVLKGVGIEDYVGLTRDLK